MGLGTTTHHPTEPCLPFQSKGGGHQEWSLPPKVGVKTLGAKGSLGTGQVPANCAL